MGIKLKREKKRDFLVSIIYKVQKLIPLSSENKLRFLLKMEWIFDRLVHENSFKYYNTQDHPIRKYTLNFILENIQENSVVLDLGSNDGSISSAIASKAKKVVGIDHDLSKIAEANRHHKKDNLEFIHQDANEYLKNTAIKFDVLILSHILEHIDDPEKFILDFKSNFKFIYIELPDFDKTYLNHYRKDLKMDLIYTDADHISEFDRSEMADLLKKTNLEVVKEEYRFGIMKIWCKV